MTIPSSQISISAINTEITSVSSYSLQTLSQNANTASIQASPYGMGEFAGYSHGPSTHTIGWGRNGPVGKISQYYTSSETGTSVPFGSYNWDSWTLRTGGTGIFYIVWSGARNDSWTYLTIGSYVAYRTSASSTTSTTHVYSGLTTANKNAIIGTTTGVFTYT